MGAATDEKASAAVARVIFAKFIGVLLREIPKRLSRRSPSSLSYYEDVTVR
jgi:hypothetical protein